MIFEEGLLYYVKDEFFRSVNDVHLMANRDDHRYRPHFFACKDQFNPNIIWLVPVSSRYKKYKMLYEKQMEKYGLCTKIVLGKCNDRNAAFLIQNAFPIIPYYLDHVHTSKGKPLRLHAGTSKKIVQSLKHNINLHQHGVKIFFPDVEKIYHFLIQHPSRPT